MPTRTADLELEARSHLTVMLASTELLLAERTDPVSPRQRARLARILRCGTDLAATLDAMCDLLTPQDGASPEPCAE